MTKMKTSAALAAQMIRKEIKAAYPGLKFTCTSENYSGGSSIRVGLTDQPVEVAKQIEKMTDKYEYGRFDGMNDCYEYSNVKSDIPQVQYLFVENRMSAEKRQEIYEQIRAKFAGGDNLPENYDDARNMTLFNDYVPTIVHRVFHGSMTI